MTEENPVKCKGFKELCATINLEHPDLRIRRNNRDYVVNESNLKKFLMEKGFLGKDGRPSGECFASYWLLACDNYRCKYDGQPLKTKGWGLSVTKSGYEKIIELLQGKEVVFPESARPTVLTSEEQKEEMHKIREIMQPKKEKSILEIMRGKEASGKTDMPDKNSDDNTIAHVDKTPTKAPF